MQLLFSLWHSGIPYLPWLFLLIHVFLQLLSPAHVYLLVKPPVMYPSVRNQLFEALCSSLSISFSVARFSLSTFVKTYQSLL